METNEQKGFERVENGDDTVTVSIEFDLDPSVVAEMSKAIPKGETREDQVDMDIRDGESEDVLSSEDDVNDAEDEEPQQVTTGNAASTQSVKTKARRSDTPLENCRAKDPMYCLYHGTKAMTKRLQDEFKSRDINGTVEVTGSGGHFKVSFTVPAQDEQSALAVIDNCLMTKRGVKKTSNLGYETKNDGLESSLEAEGKVEHDYSAKPHEILSEWVDNIIQKLASDPEMKKEVSRTDFISMIGAVGEMNKANAAYEQNPVDENLKAAADAAYQRASDAVGAVTAMMDYKGVKTSDDATAISDEYFKRIDDAKAKYAPIDQKVKQKKTELFGPRGAFPPGFAKDNPWAGVKLSPTLSDFSTTGKLLAEAASGMKATYGSLSASGKSGSVELDYSGRRMIRCALQKLEAAADMVVGHAANNEAKSKDLIANLEAWHKLNPNGIVKPANKKAARSRTGKATTQTSQQNPQV